MKKINRFFCRSQCTARM